MTRATCPLTSSSFTLSLFAPSIFALAALGAGPAWADRPLVSETADVIERGACQVEAAGATSRASGAPDVRELGAVFTCGVAFETQPALAYGRSRAGGIKEETLFLGAKTTLRAPDGGRPGFGARVRHRRGQGASRLLAARRTERRRADHHGSGQGPARTRQPRLEPKPQCAAEHDDLVARRRDGRRLHGGRRLVRRRPRSPLGLSGRRLHVRQGTVRPTRRWLRCSSPLACTSSPSAPSSCSEPRGRGGAVQHPTLLLDDVGPGGGTKRKRSADGNAAAPAPGAAQPLNCSSERWPKLSMISTAASSLPRKPTRMDWKGPPCALGVAFSHSRPSRGLSSASAKLLLQRATGQQRRGRLPQRLGRWPRTGLVEIGVVDPDLLAVGDDDAARRAWCRRSGSGSGRRNSNVPLETLRAAVGGGDRLRERGLGRSSRRARTRAGVSTASACATGGQRAGPAVASGAIRRIEPAVASFVPLRAARGCRGCRCVAIADTSPTAPFVPAIVRRGCSRCAGGAARARSRRACAAARRPRPGRTSHRSRRRRPPPGRPRRPPSPSSTPPSRMPST